MHFNALKFKENQGEQDTNTHPCRTKVLSNGYNIVQKSSNGSCEKELSAMVIFPLFFDFDQWKKWPKNWQRLELKDKGHIFLIEEIIPLRTVYNILLTIFSEIQNKMWKRQGLSFHSKNLLSKKIGLIFFQNFKFICSKKRIHFYSLKFYKIFSYLIESNVSSLALNWSRIAKCPIWPWMYQSCRSLFSLEL